MFVSFLHTSANAVSDEFGLGLSLVVPAMEVLSTAVHYIISVLQRGLSPHSGNSVVAVGLSKPSQEEQETSARRNECPSSKVSRLSETVRK